MKETKYKISQKVILNEYRPGRKDLGNPTGYPNKQQILTIKTIEDFKGYDTPVYFFKEVPNGAYEDELGVPTKLHKALL